MGIYTDWKKEVEQNIDGMTSEISDLESEKAVLNERLCFLGENHTLKSLFAKEIENGQKRAKEIDSIIETQKAEKNKYGLLKSLLEVRSSKE